MNQILSFEKDGLLLEHKKKNYPPLLIPFSFEHSKKDKVIIWKDTVVGEFYNAQIDEWFSEILSIKCHLVKMPESTKRIVDKDYAENKIVSFADAFPFMIIGQSSLDELNSRMKIQLPMNRFRTNFVFTGGKSFEEDKPMNRFRTNFVFTGGKSFEEDNWKKFKLGNLLFEAVKPCARCVITTTDQVTAERFKEPLLTLSKFRNFNNKVLFGMNLVCESIGKISVGDQITLLSN